MIMKEKLSGLLNLAIRFRRIILYSYVYFDIELFFFYRSSLTSFTLNYLGGEGYIPCIFPLCLRIKTGSKNKIFLMT